MKQMFIIFFQELKMCFGFKFIFERTNIENKNVFRIKYIISQFIIFS